MGELNAPVVDGVLNALLRAQAVLAETGSALLLANPESAVGKGLLFEADCARTAATKLIIQQQIQATTQEGPKP